MAKIADLLAAGRTASFEFFPPKSDDAARDLAVTIGELESLHPSFVSVTYGAGGSTRERTRELVVGIEATTGITTMAHLTCVAHSRADLVGLVEDYRDAGVANILALGGDLPPGVDDAEGELEHAIELVELIREVGDFSIGVAAHPEVHPRSPDRATDRRFLAEKLQLADFAITQFFFEAAPYQALLDELDALGLRKPVLPGIMPVTNVASVGRMAELSGAAFPPALAARFDAVADDPAAVRALGVESATELCQQLLEAGAPGLHFYTLNRSSATRQIYANLGLGAHGG